MRLLLRFVGMILGLTLAANAFAWNSIGHKLIAQIAYDHLTFEARNGVNNYNHALDVVYPVQSFVNASIWLDTIRYQDVKWYDKMHYVNWSFSKDGTPLPHLESVNALWAIDNALGVLSGKNATPFDKGLALRILIHVVGDIHQPMHATTLVSAEHPNGDAGGNLFPLKAGKLGKNLHAYWDKGAGLLVSRDKGRRYLRKKAREITNRWPCENGVIENAPRKWLEESHRIGINKAYTLESGAVPDKQYQLETQLLSEQRIAQAGCRLAALLNEINYQKGISKNGRYYQNP